MLIKNCTLHDLCQFMLYMYYIKDIVDELMLLKKQYTFKDADGKETFM
jgi:hypothetical protein